MKALLENPTPGVILAEEFLAPLGLSQNALAQQIGVPANRLSEIVRGRRGITADTDMRLARFFGLSEGYFLRLQNAHDLMEAARRPGTQEALAAITPLGRGHEHRS
ncbi:MAG TPA: addiction module antidote protein, HigA family [Rhodospirillaceae bacterium]|jgi:addiction module HigA family antidote|nr:HigA family addiction module antidote protein [Alphaproteobacteria bacterium]HBH26849.1 addiction module antidote protein, HigA family [Rhodospirillaceae bacterium]